VRDHVDAVIGVDPPLLYAVVGAVVPRHYCEVEINDVSRAAEHLHNARELGCDILVPLCPAKAFPARTRQERLVASGGVSERLRDRLFAVLADVSQNHRGGCNTLAEPVIAVIFGRPPAHTDHEVDGDRQCLGFNGCATATQAAASTRVILKVMPPGAYECRSFIVIRLHS